MKKLFENWRLFSEVMADYGGAVPPEGFSSWDQYMNHYTREAQALEVNDFIKKHIDIPDLSPSERDRLISAYEDLRSGTISAEEFENMAKPYVKKSRSLVPAAIHRPPDVEEIIDTFPDLEVIDPKTSPHVSTDIADGTYNFYESDTSAPGSRKGRGKSRGVSKAIKADVMLRDTGTGEIFLYKRSGTRNLYGPIPDHIMMDPEALKKMYLDGHIKTIPGFGRRQSASMSGELLSGDAFDWGDKPGIGTRARVKATGAAGEIISDLPGGRGVQHSITVGSDPSDIISLPGESADFDRKVSQQISDLEAQIERMAQGGQSPKSPWFDPAGASWRKPGPHGLPMEGYVNPEKLKKARTKVEKTLEKANKALDRAKKKGNEMAIRKAERTIAGHTRLLELTDELIEKTAELERIGRNNPSKMLKLGRFVGRATLRLAKFATGVGAAWMAWELLVDAQALGATPKEAVRTAGVGTVDPTLGMIEGSILLGLQQRLLEALNQYKNVRGDWSKMDPHLRTQLILHMKSQNDRYKVFSERELRKLDQYVDLQAATDKEFLPFDYGTPPEREHPGLSRMAPAGYGHRLEENYQRTKKLKITIS